jgi:hypothetical protein
MELFDGGFPSSRAGILVVEESFSGDQTIRRINTAATVPITSISFLNLQRLLVS